MELSSFEICAFSHSGLFPFYLLSAHFQGHILVLHVKRISSPYLVQKFTRVIALGVKPQSSNEEFKKSPLISRVEKNLKWNPK